MYSGIAYPGEICGLALYLGCLLCALACYWQSRYNALITMAESSVNLLILLAGVMVPIVHPGDLACDTAVDAGISGYTVVNFLLTDEWRLT